MFKMAFRNVFRQKRRSILTALTMFGGFALAALAIGLADGTFNSLINTFARNRLGHIQIHARGYLDRPTLNKTIGNDEQVGRTIETARDAIAWAPRVYSAGLVSVGERTDAVRIVGIDPALEAKATNFDKKIVRGRGFSGQPAKEVILGAGLDQNLKASLGDDVVIVTQGADGSLANEKYRVVGLAESGDLASDRTTLYLDIRDAQDLLVLNSRVHEIVVIARSLKAVDALNASLSRELAPYSLDVQPWRVFAKTFYTAMQAKLKGNMIVLLVLFFIVAIGVLNTALMSVLERRREYGVMKALGTRPRQIFRLILLEIQVLAVGSTILGFALSLPINYFLSLHNYRYPVAKPMTFGGMQFSTFTSELNTRSFLIPAVIVLLSSLLVSLLPAIRAARTEPAKSIRIF